jgi:hypothetical protein
LSQAIGRDYRRVHGDVEALLAAGLIERRGTALATEWDGSDADIDVPVPVWGPSNDDRLPGSRRI